MGHQARVQRYFAEAFGAVLEPLGFAPIGDMLYERRRLNICDIIAAGPRRSGSEFALGLGSVGLYLSEVEQLRHELGLERRNATVAMGLHLLLPGMTFREWTVNSAGDVDQMVPRMLDALRGIGIPFLEAFSNVEDVQKKLSEPDPRSWFMCSQDARAVNLTLIEVVRQGVGAAIQTCERLLSEFGDRAPKYSHELRGLLGRLREVQSRPSSSS